MRRKLFLTIPLTFFLLTLATVCCFVNVSPALAENRTPADATARPASILPPPLLQTPFLQAPLSQAPFIVALKTAPSATVTARANAQKGKIVPDMVISRNTNFLRIDVHYPQLDIAAIDKDTLEWATQLADNFENEFAGETGDLVGPYELGATYSLLRPDASSAITVVWDVSSYTQGAHGNLDIVTYSYALPAGTPITMPELFTDLGTALNLMSEAAFTRLSRTLGDMLVDDMLRGGTSPDADNFSTFALIPGAIRIYFQPYQVAPWAAGPQRVDIPLEELEDAGPQYKYWGVKKETADTPPL